MFGADTRWITERIVKLHGRRIGRLQVERAHRTAQTAQSLPVAPVRVGASAPPVLLFWHPEAADSPVPAGHSFDDAAQFQHEFKRGLTHR